MGEPEYIPLGSERSQTYQYEEPNAGVEPSEPVTPGSGSICKRAGYVDPQVVSPEEIGIDWTLKLTDWYSFTGTGGPVVIRLNGGWFYGAVLYRADGPPTAYDAVACSASPPRFEIDTEAGGTYLIQVGDRKWFGEEYKPDGYTIHVAAPAPNAELLKATDLPLGMPVRIGNFAGQIMEPPPTCSRDGKSYVGGRSVWGKVEVPSRGVLRVALEPDGEDRRSRGMIELYPEGGGSPIACGVGPFDAAGNWTTELNVAASPGRYWVQLMTAVESAVSTTLSNEEYWRVTADFSPNLDLDADRYARPGDCDDNNAAVHPDAVDVLDNGIDENCDGQDARRDTDKDGVPNYRDRCPAKSNKGVDADGDGCRDPQQLSLNAQVRLTLSGGRLHLVSLVVKSERGARVVLDCDGDACDGEVKKIHDSRTPFGGTFSRSMPNGTEITLTATKAGFVGVAKRFRLSTAGVRLLQQWCTVPGKPGKKTPCA
jgi:Putative metal-binding motif